MSSGGAIRIVGAWIASAPRSSSMSTSSAACSRDRVTTMRRPKSGRSSNQRRCSRRPDDRADDQHRRLLRRARARRWSRAWRRSSPAPRSSRRRSARRILRARGRSSGARWRSRRSGARRRSRRACRRARPAGPSPPSAARRSPPRCRESSVTMSPPPGYVIGMPGVRRHADRRRGCPGTTSNGICCSCRNRASLPPLSNTNGSPHLRRTTVLPSRAFSTSSSEIASWSSGARRRRADVDLLGVGARRAQQPRVDLVVVDHDVGRLELALAADADQARIPGPGADDEYAGALLHAASISTVLRSGSRWRPRRPAPPPAARPARPGATRRPRARRRMLPRAVGRRRRWPACRGDRAACDRDGAQRQLAAAAERRHHRALGLEAGRRSRRH